MTKINTLIQLTISHVQMNLINNVHKHLLTIALYFQNKPLINKHKLDIDQYVADFIIIKKMRKQERNKLQQQFLLSNRSNNQFNLQEQVQEEFIHKHKLFSCSQTTELQILKTQNYALVVQYLSMWNKSNIIQYKSIKSDTGAELQIGMEKGQQCEVYQGQLPNNSGNKQTGQQKLKMLGDLCKGLINLASLKIIHFDIARGNIVKVKGQYKIIDLQDCYLVGLPKIFPHQRNYLEGSQVQIFHEKLFEKTKQILKQQNLQQINGTTDKKKLLLLINSKKYFPVDLNLAENKPQINSEVDQILYSLELNLQKFYAQQFDQLLSLFNQEQMKQIQQAREYLRYKNQIPTNRKIPLKDLKQSLTQYPQSYQCTLSQFYNKLIYVNNSGLNMQNIFQGSLIETKNEDFKRNLLQLDQINREQKKTVQQNVEKYNESMWLTSKMQNAIVRRIQNFLKNSMNKKIVIDQRNEKIKNILSFNISDQNQKQGTQFSLVNFGQLNIQNLSNIADNYGLKFKKIELANNKQMLCLKNIKENYIAFQLVLFNFLQNKINSPLLEKPQFFVKNQNRKVPITNDNKQQQGPKYSVFLIKKQIVPFFNKELLEYHQISQKGIFYLINFMKDVTLGVIELEKIGLFHPQISLNSILFKGQNFIIKNLRKCFFISNHYRFTDIQQQLLTVNKMILVHYFTQYSKTLIENQLSTFCLNLKTLKGKSNEIRQFIQGQFEQEKKLYHDTDSDILQLQKTLAMFTYFRKTFTKIHAKQLGRMFEQLLNVSKECIPENDLYKWGKLKQIVSQLQQDEEDKRSCATTFYQQLNSLYKTCQITSHKGQIALYYLLQNNSKEKEYLCNKCIQKYSQLKMKFYCLDHQQPLLYVENNKQIQKILYRKYYCNKCIKSQSSRLQMIDSQTLQRHQNICLQIGCPNTLFPTSKKQLQHSSHQTFTFKEFAKIYPSLNANIYKFYKQQKDQQDRQSRLSHLKKIYKDHIEKINDLFQILKNVNDQNNTLIEDIMNPNNRKENIFLSSPRKFAQFFNILKTIYRIHKYSEKKGYQAISFQGFLEYANHQYQQISSPVYKKMRGQLNLINQTLEQNLFASDIQEKVRQYISNKYKQRDDLQFSPKQQSKWFIGIPKKYEQLVKVVKLERFEIQLKDLAQQRLNSTELIDQSYFLKSKQYQKWINDINQENRELEKMFKQNKSQTKMKTLFLKYYKEKKAQINLYISKEITTLAELKQNILNGKIYKNVSILQQLNCQIIDQKQKMLQYQQKYINKIFDDLKSMQMQKQEIRNYFLQISQGSYLSSNKVVFNIPQIIEKQKQIIRNLKKTLQKVEVNLRFFIIIFKTYPRSLSEQQILKLQNLTNLQRLQVTLYRNYNNFMLSRQLTFSYFLDESVLERILYKNDSLKQLYIYGGNLQLLPCLRVISKNCKNRSFIFHPDVWNSVKQSNQLQEISQLLRNQTIKLQCINIRIRKNLSQIEKQSIMLIVDKVNEIKLDIVGPFHDNGLAISILQYIIDKPKLALKSLHINGLNLQQYKIIFTSLSSKIKSLKIVNCRNFDFLINSCSSTLKDIYISGFGKNQEKNQYNTMKAISLCQNLESIQFNDSSFNTANLNLSKFQGLKNIRFRLCKNLSMDFLDTLHPKSRKTLVNFELLGFSKLQANFFTQISRMSSLRALQISQTGNSLAEYILNLNLPNLEILYMKERATTFNNQLLLKISQKWPSLSSIAIPFSETITANIFIEEFSNLKHLAVAKNQFRFQQKYLISRRGNALKRQIFIQEYS